LWARDAFGLIWKKEETLELILEENGSEDPAKPRISNRQLSLDSVTLLRNEHPMAFRILPKGLVLKLWREFRLYSYA